MFGEYDNCLLHNENNVIYVTLSSQFSYTVVIMNMNILVVVTLQSIYHGCFTRKMFWEEIFTGEEKLFLDVNMKNCAGQNVRKHKDIKGSDKYVTVEISLKFDSLDKMKITSTESKRKLEGSEKELITSLVSRPK